MHGFDSYEWVIYALKSSLPVVLQSNMFSSSLVLGDMDYIAPSQACIKPVTLPTPSTTAEVYRHVNGEAPPVHLEPIKITLQDCLACSGCVTSAETMLVTSQSRDEVETILATQDADRVIVVSISEASAASIATHAHLSLEDSLLVMSRFARTTLRADVVVDLAWSDALSSELVFVDYVRRVKQHQKSRSALLLPLIVSSCPGWVCYCEKQYPELLPLLCPVLSGQGLAGSILKRAFADAKRSVYHISIQPCFDRKLEAARDDVSGAGDVTAKDRLTDCVLSTMEMLQWMMEVAGGSIDALRIGRPGDDEEVDAALPSEMPDTASIPPLNRIADPNCTMEEEVTERYVPLEGGDEEDRAGMLGSGGYHAHVLQNYARRLAGVTQFDASRHISYEHKRNLNHRLIRTPFDDKLVFPVESANIPHAFYTAYGFQQIQNIVRALRKGPSRATARGAAANQQTPSTFLEIMACPSGCLNGGAQIRGEAHVAHEDQLRSVMSVYASWRHRSASRGSIGPTSAAAITVVRAIQQCMDEANRLSDACLQMMVGSNPEVALPELPQWSTTTFHDRKKEMEAILNSNPLHSLKW